MDKLTHEQLLARQEDLKTKPKVPLIILLNDIRSLHNVGSIFRTSDGMGVEKIIITGITGCPPSNRIAKSALGSEDSVLWEYVKDPREAVCDLKKKGYQIVILEQTRESIEYTQYRPKDKVCLIVGNEVDGISDSLLEYVDQAIEIPMSGTKNSLNVGVAFGIAGYHISGLMKG